MDAAAGASDGWASVSVDFKAGVDIIHADITVPSTPTDAVALLPALQQLTDAIVTTAADEAEGAGRRVTCRKGCGACCRQLVPISPSEARSIRNLVEDLPEPRRSEVKTRFAEARERLRDDGILDRLLDPETASPAGRAALGLRYFALGVACPFLEDESCSIHPDRPLACREFLVTTPAAHCAHPEQGQVEGVMLPTKVSSALMVVEAADEKQAWPWVPLVLAPDWAEAHPAHSPVRSGPDILRALFSRMARREIVPDSGTHPAVSVEAMPTGRLTGTDSA